MLDLPSIVSSARRELGMPAPAAPAAPVHEPHAPVATMPDLIPVAGSLPGVRSLFGSGSALPPRPLPTSLMDSRIDLQGRATASLPSVAAAAEGAMTVRSLTGAGQQIAPVSRHDQIHETVESLGGKFRPYTQALADVANGTHNVIGSSPADPAAQVTAARQLGSLYVDAIEQGASAMPRAPRVEGNKVDLLVRNEEYLPRLYADLDNAKRSITINQFNWEPDGSGMRVFDALKRKALEGLDVRVMMDGYGINERGKETANNMQVQLARVGVKFVRTDGLKPGGTGFEHRKLITIDDDVTYTGGLGFGKKYDTWTDMMVRIEGPAADVAAGTQLATYKTLTGQLDDRARARAEQIRRTLTGAAGGIADLRDGPPRSGPLAQAKAAVTFLDNTPKVDLASTEAFLRDVASAKNRVWATSTYLTSSVAKQALIDAAKRGVDVKLLTTGPEAGNDAKNIQLGRSMFGELLDAGVELYEYPSILHGKSWLIDDGIAAVGSMNLSKSSMARAREITARVEDPGFAARYAAFHEKTRGEARKLSRDMVDSAGLKALSLLGKLGLQW
jgi:cardiolipin synthase